MLYLVTYDLNKEGKDYSGMTKALESYGKYNHCQKSIWLIATTETADQIFAKLQPHIDKDDRIIVVRWGDAHQGWMPESIWNWIRDNKT